MAYEIPYDSNYSEWYGTPQNVARLSAVLEQTTDEDGNPIGMITASWDMPDNGGTFVAQLSTDGENFYIAETDIRQNSIVLTVDANTNYYLKIITVLGGSQSAGTVSNLLSTDIPTPSAPIVTVTPSGLNISIGIIPQSYTASIKIEYGETTNYVETNNLEYMYLCNAGNYEVSVAYMDTYGNVGEYSAEVTVSVEEVATKQYVDENFVNKTSHDYIKWASINGDSLMLTTGDNQVIIFQGGGGGGGGFDPITQDGDTITVPSGHIDAEMQQTNLKMQDKFLVFN